MNTTRLVTWNVNSIHARLDRVLAFLQRESPDFLCLQELKCTDERYPYEALDAAGYKSTVFGQKAYNGVAILSKKPVTLRHKNFGISHSDESARLMAIDTGTFTLINAYVPNGQAVGSEKFSYKLDWLARARQYLDRNFKASQNIVFVGDFNIAPDDRDVYDPISWKEHIHCSTPEREALSLVCGFGLVDVFRIHEQKHGIFSWWDYREMSFVANKGLRIDLIYATPPMALLCQSVRVDRDERKGEKPSDHAPVIAEFALAPGGS